jgi:hypothetical protein
MLSIEKCKEILKQYGKTESTEDEIKELRSLLSDWARIEIEIENGNIN